MTLLLMIMHSDAYRGNSMVIIKTSRFFTEGVVEYQTKNKLYPSHFVLEYNSYWQLPEPSHGWPMGHSPKGSVPAIT